MHCTLVVLSLFLASVSVMAAEDPILAKVNGTPVYLSEFLSVYERYQPAQQVKRRPSMREYLPQYINFRLKVEEARDDSLDQSTSFQRDLAKYREQLVSRYVLAGVVPDSLFRTLYARDQRMNRVRCVTLGYSTPYVTSQDTLALYRRAKALRQRLASLSAHSLESAVERLDGSEAEKVQYDTLGWLSLFEMIVAVEEGLDGLPVGQLSEPVRSNIGYHLLYIDAQRESFDRAQLSHILLLADSADRRVAQQAQELHRRLVMGEPFAEVARMESADVGSAEKGGSLGWLPSYAFSQLDPVFKSEALSLTHEGELSAPFRSSFGYHIVRLDSLRELAPYEERSRFYARQISYSQYAAAALMPHADSLLRCFDGEVNSAVLERLAALADEYPLTDSLFRVAAEKIAEPLVVVAGGAYGVAAFLPELCSPLSGVNYAGDVVRERFAHYLYKLVTNIERATLEQRNDEFATVMKEYREGMMLFEVSQREVWGRANSDSLGLDRYYNAHKMAYRAIGGANPRPLSQVRSKVMADYQLYLEQQWIDKLKTKYPVEIYWSVLPEPQ